MRQIPRPPVLATELPHSSRLRRGVAALLLAAVAGSAWSVECGRPCADVADSVVNAAGTDPKLRQWIEALRFDGPRVAAASHAEVRQIASAWARVPNAVLTLTVHADQGLDSARARTQAASRAQALQNDLIAAGLPKARVKISAAASPAR